MENKNKIIIIDGKEYKIEEKYLKLLIDNSVIVDVSVDVEAEEDTEVDDDYAPFWI